MPQPHMAFPSYLISTVSEAAPDLLANPVHAEGADAQVANLRCAGSPRVGAAAVLRGKDAAHLGLEPCRPMPEGKI